MSNVTSTIETFLRGIGEEAILEQIDEQMTNYVDDDYEDEFESVYECYRETCTDEAETDVLNEVRIDFLNTHPECRNSENFERIFRELFVEAFEIRELE